MIKASDLRIGNIFLIHGDYLPIAAGAIDAFHRNVYEFTKDIYPIPLNPNILEKCGAKNVQIMGSNEPHWEIGNYLVSQSEINRMQYLHFLQNWYYFKTFGEELKLDL